MSFPQRRLVELYTLILLICLARLGSLISVAEPLRQEHSPQAQQKFRDDPRRTADWFLKGRAPSKTGLAAAPVPPASNLLDSVDQISLLEENPATAATRGPGLASGTTPKWVELGPSPQLSDWGPVSGRVTALASDLKNDPTGNTLYVGTAFGGVWKTTQALQPAPHFVPLSDRWPSLSVGSLALDSRTNPPTIYVGTGEANNSLDSYYGVGIITITDDGKKWSKPVFKADKNKHSFLGGSVSKILVDPLDPKFLLAAIGTAANSVGKNPDVGIYESADGGNSWAMKFDLMIDGVARNCTDIVYDATHQSYFAAVNGLGIYRYQRGKKWTQTTSPFQGVPASDTNFSRISLAVRTGSGGQVTVWALIADKDGNLSRAASDVTGLVQSVDGGKSWQNVTVPSPSDALFGARRQGWYDQLVAAPAGSNAVILGGIDVWVSQSAGDPHASWINTTSAYGDVPASHPDQHAITLINQKVWIIGNDGGVWLTRDEGKHWSDINNDIGSIQLMSVTPDGAIPSRLIAASQDNGTAFGAGSVAWSTTLLGDGGFTLGNPGNAQQFFTEQFGVSIQRSDDAGRSWKQIIDNQSISEEEEKQAAFYLPYVLLPGDTDQLLVGTTRVWRGPVTPTAPGDWTPISSVLAGDGGYIQGFAVSSSAPDVAYAVTSDGRVYVNGVVRSPSPGDEWKDISDNRLPTGRPFGCIAVHPADPKEAFIGVQGFGSGHVFKTTNGGEGWDDISGNLPNTPVNSIVIDPLSPDDVYVATDVGVFVVTDGGKTGSKWKLLGPNLPRSAVLQLNISSTSPRRILAATHGRGAWSISPLHQP
jgi:photosystem II stability/assembly factor-like uncharacterized protein